MTAGRPDYTSQALMKGADSGTHRTVAVDSAGNMLSLIKGSYGGSPVAIAVDASGNMIGIIKGDYGGVLTTVKLDSAGRILVGQALVSSAQVGSTITCPGPGYTTLATVSGAGVVDLIVIKVDVAVGSHAGIPTVYVDDVIAYSLSPEYLYTWGFCSSSPGIALLTYAADGLCALAIKKVFEFKTSLVVKWYTANGQNHTVDARVYYSVVT